MHGHEIRREDDILLVLHTTAPITTATSSDNDTIMYYTRNAVCSRHV